MLNHITLMGRLTRRPELRYTQMGKAVSSFALAVERDYSKDKETDFIEVVAWGKTGELASNYLDKGDMVAVTGRLQMRDWKDRDGNKRRSAEVVAEHIYFTGKRQETKSYQEQDANPGPDPLDQFEDVDDGEIPF